jgi:hypothetical protein
MPEVMIARSTGDSSFGAQSSCFSLLSGLLSSDLRHGEVASSRSFSWTDCMDEEMKSEDIPLFLPSDIPAQHRNRVCKSQVDVVELRYRRAEFEDHVAAIRQNLRVYSVFKSKYKGVISESVAVGTRVRSEINSYWERTQRRLQLYMTARLALLILDPSGDWSSTYKELKDSDLRGPLALDGIRDLPAHTGEHDRYRQLNGGRMETSWIWLVKAKNDDQLEHMQVHWSILTAYADRFEEELYHVPEEMRRTLETFTLQARIWTDAANARHLSNQPILSAGLAAYAHRQANYYHARIRRFAARWVVLLKSYPQIEQDWTKLYEPMLDMTQITGQKVKVARIREVGTPSILCSLVFSIAIQRALAIPTVAHMEVEDTPSYLDGEEEYDHGNEECVAQLEDMFIEYEPRDGIDGPDNLI